MFDKPATEIPAAVREMAEKNVEQTRAAYLEFQKLARQSQELMAKSQGSSNQSVADVQTKAARYVEQNVEASFRLAGDLAQARDLQEYSEIQTRYAQTQVLTFQQQAKDLGRLVAEAAEKVQRKP